MSSSEVSDFTSHEQQKEKLEDIPSDVSTDKDEKFAVATDETIDEIVQEIRPENVETLNDTESTKRSDEDSTSFENLEKPFHISDSSPRLIEEDGWLDIIGSGDFKKRVVKNGQGVETRPSQGNTITISYTCYKGDDELVDDVKDFEYYIGELDIIPAFDLVIPLMEIGEVAEVLVPSRLAYGKLGRQPEIPPNCPLRYEVEITKVEEISFENISPLKGMTLGDKKRDRGNFWYGRQEYVNSITCYKRASEILDGIQWVGNDDADECTPAIQQSIVEARIKVYNNMAAAQLKLEAFDQALKSLDFVLRLQPKNVKAHFRKGKILSAKGQTEEAIASMKKAAELEPETKVIHQELAKLVGKKKIEDKSQRAMYKRMFPQSSAKPSTASKIKKWFKHGSVMAGSCIALAMGIAAYRQYYS